MSTGGASAGMGGAAVSYDKPSVVFDFENGTVGQRPAPFTGGVAAVDSTKSYSGQKSLKVSCGANQTCLSELPIRSYVAANGKTGYARFMVYVDQQPKMGPNDHYDLVRFYGAMASPNLTLPNGAYISFGGTAMASQKLHQFYNGSVGGKSVWQDCTKNNPLVVKPGQWQCVEVGFDENSIDANFSTYINGARVGPFTFPGDFAASVCFALEFFDIKNPFKGSWYVPALDKASFGFWTQDNGDGVAPGPATIWYDDIAFSKTRIGCPPAKQ